MSSTQPPKSFTPSSNAATSSPHLLKQLTAGIMTVSATPNTTNQEAETPPCKKLKLEMEESVPNTSSSKNSSMSKTTRQRLLEKRRSRRAKILESYKDNMSELFFLQSNGNVVDLPTFRKKPSHKYLNFLKSNSVPSDVMDEMRLAVLGPNAVSEKIPQVTVSTTTGKVTVSSAAMAAAVVAAHGSNWRPINSLASNSSVASSSDQNSHSKATYPPYSPRSSLLSPVKFGDLLQPLRSSSTRSTYADYRLPSYTKDSLAEKLRQEAWVTRRVSDLTREGLWSDKRLPKVCERPRPRTHWDSVLSEVKWMSVDYHEEKRWKLSAAKMLAYSAKIYVEQLADRRARARLQEERKAKRIAKFCADQVDLFWQNMFNIHTEKIPSNLIDKSTIEGEDTSESGVCNLDEDSEIEEDDDEYFVEFFYHDDESTIEEQEAFEVQQQLSENLENNSSIEETPNAELVELQSDNEKKIEDVLEHVYPGYDLTTINDIDYQQQHDSSISSEEDSEEFDSDDDDDNDVTDSEDYSDSDSVSYMNSDSEVVINLALSRPQRKLYDDYLSSSQTTLESLDAQSIADVLQRLRRICNHPQLLENPNLEHYVPEDTTLNFPRVMDGLKLPFMVSSATTYDPYADIDLKSLNLVFFAHESSLTAITSDRIRKCCASKTLIEELQKNPKLPAPVPLYNFNFAENSNSSSSGSSENNQKWSLDTSTKRKVQEKQKPDKDNNPGSRAFHKDSLNVIAKFNERRCHGMPLYGQDLIQTLTIDLSANPLSSSKKATHSVWKGSGFTKHLTLDDHELPSNLAPNFWPFFAEARKPKKAATQMRARLMKNLSLSLHLPTVNLIHSDNYSNLVTLPPKVGLVAGFNRTHLALTSKHLAVEEAIKWARSKQNSKQHCLVKNTFQTSVARKRLRDLSSKLAKLDGLLQTFRKVGERTLVFCEMPEMVDLLKVYFQIHYIPFLYLDPGSSLKAKLSTLEEFSSRSHFLALLTSPTVISQQQLVPRKFSGFTNICNVVFFDSNLNSTVDQAETLDWCRSFNGVTHLNVFKLVCEDTVEDSLSIRALQQKLAVNSEHNTEAIKEELMESSTTGNNQGGGRQTICKIKKHALDALFNLGGGNGILTTNKTAEKEAAALEEILGDPETIAQLDWLWSNKISANVNNTRSTVVEISQQVDKGCVKEELKPIERYARDNLLPMLVKEGSDVWLVDADELETAKLDWEEAYQKELAFIANELEELDKMEPQLTYSREDSSRSWHGLDGQPMPLWMPPMPSNLTNNNEFRVDEHLSCLYNMNLMEEADLPTIYVKKELKRSGAELQNDLDKHKIRKEDGFASQGGTYAPRSLFDRHPALQKQKLKAQQKRVPMGSSGSYIHSSQGNQPSSGGGNLNFGSQQNSSAVASLRHPIPRQQVEAENQPEWLIQEDWALLHTIKETQCLPLSLLTSSPAHTVNWDLVSDMVNAVSRVYRGPRQCKHRFETIIAPREEGRILYDMPSSMTGSGLTNNSAASNNKKNKKKQLNNPGLGNKLPTPKMNRPMKTSQIFNLDKNNSWSSLFATRFETIKAVANKRSPTTKPLVVNPSQKNTKHAAVLAESGISYDAPLNPIQVAANRAERIQKEKQKSAQETAAQLNQQRIAAAQQAANAAQQSAAATARVAIVQQQQQQQQQQAVVVGIPAQAGQNVRQVISHQNVQELVQRQQQQNQVVSLASSTAGQTVVVTSHPSVVSVGNLTPSQLAQTLVKAKPVGAASPSTAGGPTAITPGRLTPQQINMIKQQALLKKTNDGKARLHGLPVSAASAVVAATTNTGQKVSIAVTPSGVTLATIAASNSMPVTVVTQAMGGGQQKTQFIRGVTTAGGKTGNIRMSEADMKQLLLASKQQQLQQQQTHKVSGNQQSVAQLLQGIQSGQQVTTLVKSASGGPQTSAVAVSGTAGGSSVTIPVQMQNVQGIKTLTRQNPQQPTMVQLRHQLVQGPRSKIIPQGQGGQTILATTGQGQKVSLSQVAGAKGLPAQLIVSGNSSKPVTVQQIHQIKAGQNQQLIPHNILTKAGQAGSTVQARVIPATVAGRQQQIHVVAAPATAANAANVGQGRTAAPNVTVDASGRPTGATGTTSQIRVAAGTSQHQLLNQVLNVRPQVISSQNSGGTTTKLHVVQATPPASVTSNLQQQTQNQQNNDQQQNG